MVMDDIRVEKVNPRELYEPPSGIVIRAGVIPYTIIRGERYYLFGRLYDNKLTDMGGGCKTSRQERPIDCLFREISEEADEVTSKAVINVLISNCAHLEVWRQTANTFRDYGYPFQQKEKGPIYRYYVFLEVDDPDFKLGGITNKQEVKEYQWFSENDIRSHSREMFSRPYREFLSSQQLIEQT
jgi:hypothetical protein